MSKQSSGGGWDVDSQAFAQSICDLDRLELAPLDSVQDGLAGDAEVARGLVERHVTVRDVGHEAAADLVAQADPPGCAGGCLLAGEQPGPQPAVDRGWSDAQFAGGLVDGVEAACGVGRRCGRDLVLPN